MSCNKYNDCGCSCHIAPPCRHCIEDHNNVDNHPECKECGDILYDATDIDILKHNVMEFELK